MARAGRVGLLSFSAMIGKYGACKFKFWLTGSILTRGTSTPGQAGVSLSYFVPCAETAPAPSSSTAAVVDSSCRF